ncbi:protein midgut expression 1 [Drosophila erecta]|uniref:Protein midgut expression 1 n=1 Tax=Drosophila erecta TaxID=7220 RepID=A0A0Q5VUC7_DROER|nr:protein midgut expression 1 [Drosophila erecta]KQS61835.1 uncharacterized protein Dere_GG26503 [Drosophila erecta]
MCLVGSALCCCCKLGLKCLCIFACSTLGVLIIVALVVYFCFVYNKSEDTTTKSLPDPKMITSLQDATEAPSLARAFVYIQELLERIR